MNTQKLNELAAKAMGWERYTDTSMPGYPVGMYKKPDGTKLFFRTWNPCVLAEDALSLIEQVIGPATWRVEHDDCQYLAQEYSKNTFGRATTFPLAMTLCALRAAGIPESDIEACLHE